MMKILKRVAAGIALALVALTACSCANVTCYYGYDSSYYYYSYQISLSDAVITSLQATAAEKTAGGERWTLASYFQCFEDVTGVDYSLAERTESGMDYWFSSYVPRSEVDSDSSDSDYEVEYGFFQNKIICTTKNPVSGVGSAYESAQQGSGTLYDVLANGYSELGVTLPAFEEAFPAATGMAKSDISFTFLWQISGVESPDGELITDEYGNEYVKWTATYNTETHDVTYYYYTVNSLGWYVVILGIGIVVTVIVFIATKKRKETPKMEEPKKQHNGSPFGYGGRANGADAQRDHGKIDPFEDEAAERERLKCSAEEIFGADDAQKVRKELDDIFGIDDDDKK